MLSKEDLNSYLRQIEKIETDMFFLYKKCAEIAEDEKIKKVCGDLSESEAEHSETLKKTLESITPLL